MVCTVIRRFQRLPGFILDVNKSAVCKHRSFGLSKTSFKLLTQLAEKGARVKATGFSRGDIDVTAALKTLYSANPNALMFGSDLPSTRVPRPYSHDDFILVAETLGKDAAMKVFSDNAIEFYKPAVS